MNQRAHIRRAVDMPARLSNGEFADRPCQVRDFCLGGMLVTVSPAEKTLVLSLQKGDALTVSVDVQGLRGTRSVTLRARLARKIGPDLGLAFDAPDSTSLLAVQNHVRSLLDSDHQPLTRQPTLNREQARHAATQLLDITRRFCLTRLEVFFPVAREALLAMADKATTNEAQHPWFEAAKLLGQNATSLSRNFVARSSQTLEQLSHGLASQSAATSQEDHRNGKLSLVDKDIFEDWLTLKVMASRAESHFNEELLHLQLRFDELFAISLSARKNPLHPSTFCNAFGESLRLLPLKQKTDRVILATFDETVINHLHDFYRDCNQSLARNGVLADLDVGRYISERYNQSHPAEPAPPEAGKKSAPVEAGKKAAAANVGANSDAGALPQTPAAEAGQAEAALPASSAAAAASAIRQSANSAPSLAARQFALQQHIAKHAYETVRKLLSSHSVEAARHRTAAQQVSALSAPIAEEQLDATLNQLQRSLHEDTDLPLPLRVKQALQGDQDDVHLDHDAQAAVDVIHNLFAGILANPALSDRVRGAIRKLEVPFLRLLLNDDSFLQEESHPARQMLNRIAHLGVRGSANLQAHESEIDQEVQSILSGFDDDTGIFSESLQKLDRLAERQQTLYLRNMKRVTESCDGRYKVVVARREVNQALERRIGGKTVPKAVLSLIDAGWRQLLIQTLLRSGRDSRDWHEYLGVIDRMIRSVDQVPAQEDLTAILASIKAGLGQVDHTQMQNARLISELRDLLSRKARDQQTPDMVEVPAGLVEEAAGGNAEAQGEIEQRWARRAQRHDVGDWFSYFDNGQDQMVRLAWTDMEKQTFVFVNHQGMKVTEYSLEQFAERLASGQMQQIDNLDAPAVDRGLESMVQKVYDQMAHQATHDDLCDLINRREFERRLRQRLAAGKQHGTLLHLDIDQFKVVNNLAGPQAGDELLVKFSALLKEQFPGTLVARLGGDEFAIWLEDLPAEAALRAAEQLCRRIPNERFVCGGKPFSITVSCGLVQRENPATTAAELMRNADSACHAAKESGRNRLQRYAADDKELVKRDDIMAWVTRLNEAIESNRLMLRCQRIESTSDGSALPAYEVLISISGDEGELIAPSEFMHAAERYNRMHAVDRWVVSNVLRWMHANPRTVEKIDHLSINLSGHSLNDTSLLEFLFEMFQLYPVPRDRICFEVTETAAISNLEDAADFIRELQGLGCRFSLDDFGSGLASYGHLKHLPVDYIKIDGSFIRDVADDPADLALVRSINEMGHLMGKRTIAEYVENDQIRGLMAEIGVDYVQGYGVEKPRPLDTLSAA
jgi:diguanylate cyclase (GGDEF)-like protein